MQIHQLHNLRRPLVVLMVETPGLLSSYQKSFTLRHFGVPFVGAWLTGLPDAEGTAEFRLVIPSCGEREPVWKISTTPRWEQSRVPLNHNEHLLSA